MKARITHIIFALSLIVFGLWGCSPGKKGDGKIVFDLMVKTGQQDAFFKTEYLGRETNLREFYQTLSDSLGKPRVVYLNYTLEEPEEFYYPEKRSINPDILLSPFGIQKIMVWDNLHRKDWADVPLQLSVQVEEKRRGHRPIDPIYTEIQIRARSYPDKQDLIAERKERRQISKWFSMITELDSLRSFEVPSSDSLLFAYEDRLKAFKERVNPLLSGDCYPPITYREGWPVFDLQLCEPDSMADTLSVKVIVEDKAGNPLPFKLYDMMADTLRYRIDIYAGYLGYSLYSPVLSKIHRIQLQMDTGEKVVIYEKGDFFIEPLPFRPRYWPEKFNLPQGQPARPERLFFS